MLEGCTPFPAEFAERYVREGIWRRETIPQAIAKAALDHPDSIAVSDSTRSLTYSQLITEAGTLATLLSRNGIDPNDRIVIQLPNCVGFATLTIACLEIGAIPVMALPAFRKAELEYLLSFSDAKAIAIAPEYRGFDHAALARDLKCSASFFRRHRPLDASRCMNMAPHRARLDLRPARIHSRSRCSCCLAGPPACRS